MKRRIAAVVLAGLVAAGLTYRHRMMDVLAQVPGHAEFWRNLPPGDGPLLVVLGDSSAQGVGAVNPLDGWVGVVASHLRECHPDLGIRNISLTGAKVAHVVNDQLPVLRSLGERPWQVICAIGSNDVALLDRPLDRFDASGFASGIEAIAAAMPRGSVFVEVPYFGTIPHQSRVERSNRIIHEVAERHGHAVAPVHAASRFPLHRKVRRLAGDIFHPNEIGYRDWAAAILQTLEDLDPGR
jgi:acyl-CoA thioesterase-1